MTKQAFVFPGQGSQTVGMLADLAAKYPQIQTTFSEASEALGYDLWDLVQHDENQQLNQTHITQPALLTASVAIYRLLMDLGYAKPDYMAGHSLGEYSALVCADVIGLKEAVKLVEARGQFMQQAVPAGEGAMYAIIGLADDLILEACEKAQQQTGEVVSAVNFNSPGQVVIAGTTSAAEVAANLCKEAGAKRALPLSVSVPSHCALMKPAAEKLAGLIESIAFAEPSVAVINNVDVNSPKDANSIKDALVRQLYCPVRWTETIESLASQNVEKIYEVGPGKVLIGLIKRINKSIETDALNTVESVQNLL
ncbi:MULTISPECIES: ACP S-malonyltransferase [Alteromonadaceae]|uniref:ACP S-malonyltransferase n=1 Tax=Alteromonadaceae TaxID=72275 RepID=UPI001C08A4BE|nr:MULTISPECIES: ACP S-malonyltransferase [Aliiglaciecola]MBU2876255.1 ACP S-malonyltransferase [Aliiglaciecola lipolytica]MDO6710471.1 ACP S-malonyltransferase [Aliiglaciecola sp. 2_MG-2023]MDO6751664.1 ACP S-malonyltransferase [Aliiglaciecola sp. 1_MG-2023]